MKRSERRHLKTNEVATTVARLTRLLEERAREIKIGLIAAGVVLAGVGGYAYWQGRVNAEAAELLAGAMAVMQAPVTPPAPETPPPEAGEGTEAPPPAPAPLPNAYPTERAKLEAALPKFLAAAEAHPSTPAGIAGRYHTAAVLALLERPDDAAQRYREVIDRAGDGVYRRMATMGLAELQIKSGDYDPAIETLTDLSSQTEGDLPVDAILMRLGQAHEAAGKPADALAAYERVSNEFPESPYAPDAGREARRLGPTVPDEETDAAGAGDESVPSVDTGEDPAAR